MTPQSCVGLCGEGNNSWHPCAHLNDEREWAQHREPCQQCSVSSACMHAHVVPIFTSRDVPLAAAARVSPHGSGVDLCTHAAVRCDTQGRLTQGSTVVHACKHRHLSECARHTWQSVPGTRTGTWQSGRVCPSHAFGRVCPAHAQALGRVCPAHAQALGRVCPVQAQALGRVCPASAKPRFCPILTPSQHPNRFSRSCLREHGDRRRVTMAVPRTACTVRTGCTPQARRVPLSRSTRRKRRTQSRRVRSAAGRERPEGIVASRAPWPQHTNEPQTPRACPGAVRVARHRPASPGSCAALQCTSRTAPRARRARRAAPTHARRRVPRCVPGPGVCGAPVPGSGVRPARCAHAARARRVPGVRHSEQQRQSAAGPCLQLVAA